MFRLPKFLSLIFIVLLLVVFAEIGYYLYIQFSKSSNTQIAQNNQRDVSVPSLSLITPTPVTPADQALPNSFIDYMKKQKKDLLISASLTTKFQGKITMLDTKGGINPLNESNKFQYKLLLTIQGEKLNARSFAYNERGLALAKIVKAGSGDMKIDELKVGDNIALTETYDILKKCANDECLLDLKIEKI